MRSLQSSLLNLRFRFNEAGCLICVEISDEPFRGLSSFDGESDDPFMSVLFSKLEDGAISSSKICSVFSESVYSSELSSFLGTISTI